MHIENERVCHTISRLKHGIRKYMSCGQAKYFSEISCLTPPNIPGLKWGGI